MPFVKAAPKQAKLKMSGYGPPGSGKTFTALLVAEGLAKRDGKRIAYIDTETGGTDYYSVAVAQRKVHPEAFDFDASYTKSLSTVIEDVHNLDPKVHGVIVLDSMSHIWDAAIESYTGKKVGKTEDKIPFGAWAALKKPYKDLLRWLIESPFHVIILGRQKALYEDDGDSVKKIGVGMRAEAETPHEPHVCFRMEAKTGEKDGTVFAHFEKDRSGVLQGKVIPNPTYGTFEPLVDLLGAEQRQGEDADEVVAKDSELLLKDADKQAAKAEKSAALYASLNAATVKAETMEALMAVAVEVKKQRKYLTEEHYAALGMAYQQQRKSVTAALAPQEV